MTNGIFFIWPCAPRAGTLSSSYAKLTLPQLPRTVAEILERLVDSKADNMPVPVARHILAMHFAEEDVDRMNELSAKGLATEH